MLSRKTYRFRLYPNREQRTRLLATLEICRELYNAALQERRGAYNATGKGVTFTQQSAQLPTIKPLRPDVGVVYSQVLQDVLHRIDKTYHAFFLRVQRGQKAGFPRFKSRDRYDSFTYPQLGFRLLGTRLRLSKIGLITVKLHRPIDGAVKTLTIRREAGSWYACFSVGYTPTPLPLLENAVGLDLGLNSFAVLSDGTAIPNPRCYHAAQAHLRRVQRRVARRKKGSTRRRKAVLLLQKAHAHIQHQRNNFHHTLSRSLVQHFGIIAVERLNVHGLAGGMLAKPVHDAGWSSFLSMLSYKAADAGRTLIAVDPRGTSQTCLCGASVPKTLSDRAHICLECELIAPRDVVSAQLILQRARTEPSSVNVETFSSCVA